MDILNNIWTAISTPNEELLNVLLSFLVFFLEAPLTILLINNLFKLHASRTQKLIYVLCVSTTGSFATYVIPSPYNMIFNYIITFLVVHFLFNCKIIKNILITVFPTAIFTLLELLFLHPYLNIFNITYETANSIPLYRIPFALFMYFIIFIINLIFKYKNFKINIFDEIDKSTQNILILNFIFGLLAIIVLFILTINYIDTLSLTFTFFNFICLLMYFILSLYSLTRITKLAKTTQKLESTEEYNKTLHILHDSVRGFKHDFDNIVTTIGGYIKTNDMNGLKKYYSQLEEDCQKVNNLYILNPDIINNPGIYNLLTTKYSEAEEKGIKINLTFLLDLNELHMKVYEFARILGILLDNAIEATSECDKKVLNIAFRNDSKNNRNIILIENTYNDKNVNINEIFNKGVSGKENHTGLGLWEIRQILKKNNNINLHTSKNDKYFSQQLEIYY